MASRRLLYTSKTHFYELLQQQLLRNLRAASSYKESWFSWNRMICPVALSNQNFSAAGRPSGPLHCLKEDCFEAVSFVTKINVRHQDILIKANTLTQSHVIPCAMQTEILTRSKMLSSKSYTFADTASNGRGDDLYSQITTSALGISGKLNTGRDRYDMSSNTWGFSELPQQGNSFASRALPEFFDKCSTYPSQQSNQFGAARKCSTGLCSSTEASSYERFQVVRAIPSNNVGKAMFCNRNFSKLQRKNIRNKILYDCGISSQKDRMAPGSSYSHTCYKSLNWSKRTRRGATKVAFCPSHLNSMDSRTKEAVQHRRCIYSQTDKGHQADGMAEVFRDDGSLYNQPMYCRNRNPAARFPSKGNKGARPVSRMMRKFRKRLRTGR